MSNFTMNAAIATTTIRTLEQRDVPACMGVAAVCWEKLIGAMAQADLNEAFGTSPWKPVFYVADRCGDIVGFAAYGCTWVGYNVYSLTWVCTRPQDRGHGIATALVTKCLDDLRPVARMVTLLTEHAESLYKKFGFQTVYRLPAETGPGTEAMMVWRP